MGPGREAFYSPSVSQFSLFVSRKLRKPMKHAQCTPLGSQRDRLTMARHSMLRRHLQVDGALRRDGWREIQLDAEGLELHGDYRRRGSCPWESW